MTNPGPTPKQQLANQILTLMGNNLIEIDHTVDDIYTCIDIALDRYKQRSSDSMQEAIFFLRLQKEQQTYTLPKEIVEVRKILRRGLGTSVQTGLGNQYDPFTLAYTNLYLLQPTGQGDLLTYELYSQWLETAGKLFGSEYNFIWDHRSRKLTIIRNQLFEEEVGVYAYMRVPDDDIITGTYSAPWIRSYAMAQFKMLLGQAYEKFSAIPSVGGSITLNGGQLKAEAVVEIEKLEREIQTYTTGGTPLGIIIG